MSKLEVCKRCLKREFDSKKGLLCSITKEKPDFYRVCPHFEKDEKVEATLIQTKRIKSNNHNALFAMNSIKLCIAVLVLFMGVFALIFNLFFDYWAGKEMYMEDYYVHQDRLVAIYIIYIVVLLIAGIAFLIWFYRAYFNIYMKSVELRRKPNWVFWSCFIPLLHLYFPFQIMKEMYKETNKYLIKKGVDEEETPFLKNVYIWWFLAILTLLLSISLLFLEDYCVPENMSFATSILFFVGLLLRIVLFVQTNLIIKNYSKMEEKMINIEFQDNDIIAGLA